MEGRIPPHSLEAEQSVLGAILLDYQVLDEIEGLLPTPEAFYAEAHRKIYAAMQGLRAEGSPVDLVTLAEELSRRDMGYVDITPENYEEITGRMEQYMQEFQASGVDRLVLEE